MKNNRKRIILINPSLSYEHKKLEDFVFPITGLLLIGTVLQKAGWDVLLLDGNHYDIGDFKAELKKHIDSRVLYIGFSVMTCQVPWSYEICKHIKLLSPEIPIVWGGVHATLFPEQTAEDPVIDVVVINEAIKDTILPLTTAIVEGKSLENIPALCYEEDGKVVKTRQGGLDQIDGIPFIDFSLIDHQKYAAEYFLWKYYPDYIPYVDKSITYPIVTGLGCAYRCSFCINPILKRTYRRRSAEEIIDRIQFLQKEYGANFFQFMDEDFMINKERTMRFLDLIEQKRLKFYYRAWFRVDQFRDDYIDIELAKRLQKNGLLIGVMGAESGSPDVLTILNKRINPDQIMRAAETLKQTEIIPRFSFMVGIPGETKKDLLLTKAIIEKLRAMNPRADVPVINFRPYPGSKLYNELLRNGMVKEPKSLYEWSKLDFETGHGWHSCVKDSPWIKEKKLCMQMDTHTPKYLFMKQIYRKLPFRILQLIRHAISINYTLLPGRAITKINRFFGFLYNNIRRWIKRKFYHEVIPNVLVMNFPTEITQNWGCKASIVGLDSVLKGVYPLSNFKSHEIFFGLPDIPVPRDPAKFHDYIEYLDSIDWKEFSDFGWADVVIFDGEGTIHEHDDYKTNSYIYLKLLTIYAAKIKYEKKTAIVNHTLDFNSIEFEGFVKTVYPTCDYLSVREPKSKELLARMGITANLTADTAFIYTDKLAMESMFHQATLKTNNSFKIPERYYVFFIAQLIDVAPSYFVKLCRAIWKAFNIPAVFFILSDREKRVVESIRATEVPHIVIESFVEPSYIIEVLRGAEFCLSGRFHTTIFSALANTPFIGFRSNTFKIAALIQALNYPFREMIFGETSIDEIINTIAEIKESKNEIKENLEGNVKSQQRLAVTTNVKLI